MITLSKDISTAEAIASALFFTTLAGIEAILQQHPLYKRSWGFDLAEISLPVHIWHGSPAWSVYLAEYTPNAITHFIPDAMRELLQQLLD